MSAINPAFDNAATRDRREIKKNADTIYKNSFGDLPDGTIYRDPAGHKTEDGVELQKARWEQLRDEPVFEDGSSVVQKWNELQRKGFSVSQTTNEIRKSLDTGNWALPLDIIPEVYTVNPEQLPMADTLARVTTQDDEVDATPLQEHPSISFGLEANASTDSDGNRVYENSDASYGDLSFPVEGYGAATRISDKMILASNNLRNAESTTEQAFVRAMRQAEERQIIKGTNNAANGFDGFEDFISSGDGSTIQDLGDPSAITPSDVEEAVREAIDDAEYEGAERSSLGVVIDFEGHRLLRESITDNVHYNDPTTEVMAGFETLDYDGVPVMKSHAITRLSDMSGTGTTENFVYTVNTDATYMSMLQETNVRPLARLGPQERMAVDAYGTLVSEENGAHIRAISATVP